MRKPQIHSDWENRCMLLPVTIVTTAYTFQFAGLLASGWDIWRLVAYSGFMLVSIALWSLYFISVGKDLKGK